ncbi:protocatechuate 3,4-dioxygenase subunit alpha [Nocardia abscessus]|uniref:protocatechuate 3,4-dioxygenase subunit alpha n=1 Tax=Nocardia abscessus TaxID=120957 RepID=UPI002458EF72|nr:protocatechuate 3,4-dioxygenase subunit alpha [Nocardia abscessus]
MAEPRTTPGQTIGPFYGYALPYARGHELVPPAHPQAIRLSGNVFDGAGVPVPDALLEIRQAGGDGTVAAVPGSLRRDGRFTGWGRAATDAAGQYGFTTVEPGSAAAGAAPFFSVVVFARGLLDRLFTRVYLPEHRELVRGEPLFADLEPERLDTLFAERIGPAELRFDIRLQGERETVFLRFPAHGVTA